MGGIARLAAACSVILASCAVLVACGDPADERPAEYRSVLRYAVALAPSEHYLDPARAEGPWESMQAYAGLVRYGRTNDEVEPDAAERFERSEDGLRYVFHLRRDGRWSNGDPVTAHDFVFSWLRALDPATGNPYPDPMFAIAGAREYAAGTGDRSDVAIRALDDRTLEVRLSAPVPWFETLVASSTFLPVHRPTVQRHNGIPKDPKRVVVNGPWRIVEHLPQKKLVYKRNTRYWAAERMRLERVEQLVVRDADLGLEKYVQRDIDGGYPLIRAKTIERARTLDGFDPKPSLDMMLLLANQFSPRMRNVNLRRAVALAIDRRAVADRLGYGSPDSTGVPVTLPGYGSMREHFEALLADDGRPKLEAARRELQRAGYRGERLRLYGVAGEPELITMKRTLETAGINVELKQVSMEQFNELHYSARMPADIDLVTSVLYADYPDPHSMLAWLRCDSPSNNIGYCDRRFDRLVDRAERTLDPDQRYELEAEALSLLVGTEGAFPYIPTAADVQRSMVHSYVKGHVETPAGVYYDRISVREK